MKYANVKNQIKLLLISAFLVFITVFISYINYNKSKNLQQEFIDKTINDTVEKVKSDIDNADMIVDILLKFKIDKLESIHKEAIKILQKNPNTSLDELKKQFDKKFLKENIKLHFYLINNKYIIYDTTYKKDLDLDMKLFKGASVDIKKASNNPSDIVIASPSIDILNSDYRIYSYGLLNKKKNIVLEIGYFDSSISSFKKKMYQNSSVNSLVESIELFGDYQSYIVNLSKDNEKEYSSKQDYLNYLASKMGSDENKIIKKVSKNNKRYEAIENIDGKKYKVIYVFIEKNKKSKYKKFVLKLRFDISKYQKDVENIKFLFMVSLLLLIIVFILYFNYLRISIINPMDRKIDKQYKELEQLNITLEQKVKDQVDEIKTSVQKFEIIFNTVKDGIAIMDQDSKFLIVNDAYTKITGLTREELYKTSCIELTDKDYIESSKQAVKEVNEKGYCYNFEKVCDFGDRKLDVVMDIVKMPYTNNILIVTKDVTKIKQKDKKVLEQSRLAQMGEMISMIAHQWRQPLGAISSAVVSIQNKISLGKFDLSVEEDREKFEKFLNKKTDQIEDYIEFLSTTIDEFRDFYKKDKDKVTMLSSQIIEDTLKIVKVSMENKNINIETKLKDDIPFLMYKNELMQVVLNILKNSEDNFLEKEQELKQITIETKYEDSIHKIIIQDNGGGIDEKILPNIFKPYFSTKEAKNGTGLGLYMSKTIVQEHHNGNLKVQNTNDGVMFVIEI